MVGILKNMTKSYETGECLNGEDTMTVSLPRYLSILSMYD